MKLLILSTHPIQYQVPWFRALAAAVDFDLTVAFGLIPSAEQQSVGFGVPFEWDLPLLEGYRSITLELAPGEPSLSRFRGIRARNLRAAIERERPEVILVTGWNSWLLLQGVGAARRLGIPSIVRGESNDLRARRAPVRWLQRTLLRRFDSFLSIGRANRRFLESRGVAAERIFDAPYFVDNARFARSAAELEAERAAIRSGWGIAEGATCALFAGKLIAKKRPLDLVLAIARAREAGADLHLLIAGEGELRAEMEREAARLAVPVSFAGFLNQTRIPRAYIASDLLVLPSDAGETWGLVVNEAMACGRPAAVSDLVGCREDLIEEGTTGWSYPCGDVAALAARLVEAARSAARLVEMGAVARAKVCAGYSVENAVAATLRACELAQRGKGAG